MTPAARLSAAIEVIETIEAQRIPAANALKAWGVAHRFAGSGDRAAISGACIRYFATTRVVDVFDGR
jgi:16S rRNA (cytosine967-C5)-methyltransferase